jgi:hypothetical protein
MLQPYMKVIEPELPPTAISHNNLVLPVRKKPNSSTCKNELLRQESTATIVPRVSADISYNRPFQVTDPYHSRTVRSGDPICARVIAKCSHVTPLPPFFPSRNTVGVTLVECRSYGLTSLDTKVALSCHRTATPASFHRVRTQHASHLRCHQSYSLASLDIPKVALCSHMTPALFRQVRIQHVWPSWCDPRVPVLWLRRSRYPKVELYCLTRMTRAPAFCHRVHWCDPRCFTQRPRTFISTLQCKASLKSQRLSQRQPTMQQIVVR